MTLQQLPKGEAEYLARLKANKNTMPAFRGRVKDLRDAGWHLRPIGEAVGVDARSTVRMWEMTARARSEAAPADANAVPRPPVPAGSKIRSLPLDVPMSERASLVELANRARSVRGWTPADADSRTAAAELDRMIRSYRDRGIPLARVAGVAGVTRRAIAARLERTDAKAS